MTIHKVVILTILMVLFATGTAHASIGNAILAQWPMATKNPAQTTSGPQVQSTTAPAEKPIPQVPDMADIIPKAKELSSRLAGLRNRVPVGIDVNDINAQYAKIKADIQNITQQFQALTDSNDYRYDKLVGLKTKTETESEAVKVIDKPLRDEISQLGALRNEWLGQKKRWDQWQSSLLKDDGLSQLEKTFAEANDVTQAALDLITRQLQAMLTIQEKGGDIQAQIGDLAAILDGRIQISRHSSQLDVSAPMFSSLYASQFGSNLWYDVRKGFNDIAWPNRAFFVHDGWIVLLQLTLTIVLILIICNRRQVLADSDSWQFIAMRPYSAGLFLAATMTVFLYYYWKSPAAWNLLNALIAAISLARLLGAAINVSWKKHFVYWFVTVLIFNRIIYVISLPVPLFRLYLMVTAFVTMLLCVRWARESHRRNDSPLINWSLWLGTFLLAVLVFLELWGKDGFGEYLFVSSIRSLAMILAFALFVHMFRGALDLLFHSYRLSRAAFQQSDADHLIRQLMVFTKIIVGVLLLSAILVIWRVYDSLDVAIKSLLKLGLNLGSKRFTLGLMISAAALIYGSILASWIIQKVIIDKVLVNRRVESGVRLSIGRLANYIIISIGFILAIVVLNFELTKLTIMISALGVGIGFGLQSFVNNFISGLILLFERPVRVGDTIELNDKWVKIKHIGLRATAVQTLDFADVIIPNADLITNAVTNWTLTNRLVGLTITVGVAYGSDVPLVMKTLMDCGISNEMVAKYPTPRVLFLGFGESTLSFELWVWILDADERLKVKSELNEQIDHTFRKASIEIAFPQRDLHIRSIDESVILHRPDSTE